MVPWRMRIRWRGTSAGPSGTHHGIWAAASRRPALRIRSRVSARVFRVRVFRARAVWRCADEVALVALADPPRGQ
ncbi:hypothetical protein GCM10025874_20410 [Arenivirga flava]|uniref:Uncharacterized protein n=1 Tax=Arenivirga flava TaxID=1930060 RepID=A0AA37UEE3_9MICO|nr:hypothetical protein GCM10025874_20410 [Arenivirga flava]